MPAGNGKPFGSIGGTAGNGPGRGEFFGTDSSQPGRAGAVGMRAARVANQARMLKEGVERIDPQ
jgi:hypothetical protein